MQFLAKKMKLVWIINTKSRNSLFGIDTETNETPLFVRDEILCGDGSDAGELTNSPSS